MISFLNVLSRSQGNKWGYHYMRIALSINFPKSVKYDTGM